MEVRLPNFNLENMNDKEWWMGLEYYDVEKDETGNTYNQRVDKIISEAQRREREEIVKMVLDLRAGPIIGGWECTPDKECQVYNDAIRDVINAIKEKK